MGIFFEKYKSSGPVGCKIGIGVLTFHP